MLVPTYVWLVPLVAVLITQLTVLTTTVYLHRALAHRAIRVHPALDIVFRAILWLTTGMQCKEWVAVHRKHHAFTDREGDPHSPYLLGFWKVQLWNIYYYAREARNPDIVRKFAPDIHNDAWERYAFSRGWTGLALGGGLVAVFIGFWPALAAMLLHGLLYVFVLSPSINGLGHWRGQQNFSNTAYNSRVLAWFTGGESLHNNHHAFPKSPRFSVRPSEFDPSWPVIKLLRAVRLVQLTGAPASLAGHR
jgi:stearoyl-CoA desaturase (delta-9 desaturase)